MSAKTYIPHAGAQKKRDCRFIDKRLYIVPGGFRFLGSSLSVQDKNGRC